MRVKKLNKREVERILRKIKERFGCLVDPSGYSFYITNKGRIFLCTRGVSNLFSLKRGRVEGLGLYFAFLTHRNEIRLSVEGSQIIFPRAKKNIFYATNKQILSWIRGFDLDLEQNMDDLEPGFVLIVYKNDCFGCGRFTGSRIINYVRKSRRIINLKEV